MFTPEQFPTFSLESRPAVTRVLASAMNAVDAGAAVRNHLRENPLPSARRVFAFGLGKAACAMTSALADSTELVESLVVTKHASLLDFERVAGVAQDTEPFHQRLI